MKPEQQSQRLLSITRSKAKMYEYSVPEEDHIQIYRDPASLFSVSIGLLGDLAAQINSGDLNGVNLSELRENLRFSAHFFDAYLHSKLNDSIESYLLLLGASSYYLCDLPGSSIVLAKAIGQNQLDVDGAGLEILLLWILTLIDSKNQIADILPVLDGVYGNSISNVSSNLVDYYKLGRSSDELTDSFTELRTIAYRNGTPRQLLFADIICALARKRILNSTWSCLPDYSGLSVQDWSDVLQKDSFIRELWPAQHLLGRHGVFNGKSAVVQMPTSAGKTKATEIIIRSAFLSGRAFLVIVVAPFRALCHEIRDDFIAAFRDEPVKIDEFSDVLQVDFFIDVNSEEQQIWVVTPEKLLYMLRHNPEFAENIGLLIYDEGHQFDNGTRGITYELLLTSLKSMVPEKTQTILISAVISNAEDVNNWLNAHDSGVVSGINLTPTYRTVAFASWLDRLGRLEFVTPERPNNNEFFVPRVIEQHQLQLKGKERKPRVFPEKNNGNDIALYFGLKLIPNGSVAVFCGTKASAIARCERMVDVFGRGYSIAHPMEYSDKDEIRKLSFLIGSNLGPNSVATQCAQMGIFAHHGNTPQGIRLAVEYALKEGFIKYVICTSTLAQGVNLPIRYLILANVYQGKEQIKVRDFHNLIGRAGRSGMHTEGSVIFADPTLYDNKGTNQDKGRWGKATDLLISENSEPCASSLLSIFEPWRSDNRRFYVPMEDLQVFIRLYIEVGSDIFSIAGQIVAANPDKDFTIGGLEKQIDWKLRIISAIESYLMAHWDNSNPNNVSDLATGTLAYYLADEDQKQHLIDLFKLLAENIEQKITETKRRQAFGRTLYGVRDSIAIEEWVSQNIEELVSCGSHEDLLSVLWSLFEKYIKHSFFERCTPSDALKEISESWILGKPFHSLFTNLQRLDAKLIYGDKQRNIKIEHVVDFCENALSYEGTLILGAVTEVIELIPLADHELLIRNLQELQKKFKYGLSSASEIALYEIGFADRVISSELSSIIGIVPLRRQELLQLIAQKEQPIREALDKYPTYFSEKLNDLLQ